MVAPRRAVLRKKKAKTAYRTAETAQVLHMFAKSSTDTTVKEASGNANVEAWILKRAESEAKSISALGVAIAANPEPASPELARSLQAEENWWRKIERELPSLSSTEVAEMLGGNPNNRNLASSQRAAGKLLGYARRHAIRYPRFQFDMHRGTVLPVIAELLALTRGLNVPDEDVVLWMGTHSSAFADQGMPVDYLKDPERLLAAAEDHFGAIW
ncbi:hypothetical protein AB4089_17430 [Arthrobacter sp. 2MCAF15]|uniref:hypothetical protein n=1 Tax=Arthrobacter sp. 2MCAF15 TaxID=3232984 RepID=UPI003F915881